MKKFTVWLIAEINSRGWLPAELAKRAGLTQGGLSRILSGERKPGPEACVGIARALGLSPECVFRKAGLLPPEPDPAPGEQDVLNVYRGLNEQERITVLAMLRGLAGKPVSVVRVLPPGAEVDNACEMLGRLDAPRLELAALFIRWLVEQPGNSGQPVTWEDVTKYFASLSPETLETVLTNLLRRFGRAAKNPDEPE